MIKSQTIEDKIVALSAQLASGEITKEEYKVLAEYFAEYHPGIKVNLIVCDDNLEKLGFCSKITLCEF